MPSSRVFPDFLLGWILRMRLGSGPSQVLQSSVCTHENGGLMLKKKVNVFAFYAMEREFKHSVERNRVYKG